VRTVSDRLSDAKVDIIPSRISRRLTDHTRLTTGQTLSTHESKTSKRNLAEGALLVISVLFFYSETFPCRPAYRAFIPARDV